MKAPQVIYPDFKRAAVATAFSGALVLLGAFSLALGRATPGGGAGSPGGLFTLGNGIMVSGPELEFIAKWLAIPLFGFISLLGVLGMLKLRPLLLLAEEGIVFPTLLGSVTVPWKSIKSFCIHYRFHDHVASWTPREHSRHLGIKLKASDVAGRLRAGSMRRVGLCPFDIPYQSWGVGIEDALEEIAAHYPDRDIPISGLKPARPLRCKSHLAP